MMARWFVGRTAFMAVLEGAIFEPSIFRVNIPMRTRQTLD